MYRSTRGTTHPAFVFSAALPPCMNPKIVFWDIETSTITTRAWDLYPNHIPYGNIVQDWYIICASWLVAGQSRVNAVSVLNDPERFKANPRDDYYVVKKLREALEDVDILVHHNGDRFDLKKFNARLIYHKLPPLPKILTVDTLKKARQVAKFTSNRLDFLGISLIGKGKISAPYSLWEEAEAGNARAIKDLVRYNKEDVRVLQGVYDRLLPYMVTHPNVGSHGILSCPKCAATDYKIKGYKLTAAGTKRAQYQCNSCGSYFTPKQPISFSLTK